jgi:peptide/nickel transport system ATP-binding protein
VSRGGEISITGPVLSTDLSVDYPQKGPVLRRVRIEVLPGETVGLVGESGSGKSTLALAVLGLLGQTGAQVTGSAMLIGRDLLCCSERELREVRGRLVSLIPQNPTAALNPALRLGTQLREAWHAHSGLPWAAQADRVARLLADAGLPSETAFLKRYPSEISIGQAQRVLIVMALLHGPRLLIADEPTSALDVITQKDVIDLLSRAGGERSMSTLLISHDLVMLAGICSRLAILHDGQIVESGPTRKLLSAPQHPYTSRLIAAIPKWKDG